MNTELDMPFELHPADASDCAPVPFVDAASQGFLFGVTGLHDESLRPQSLSTIARHGVDTVKTFSGATDLAPVYSLIYSDLIEQIAVRPRQVASAPHLMESPVPLTDFYQDDFKNRIWESSVLANAAALDDPAELTGDLSDAVAAVDARLGQVVWENSESLMSTVQELEALKHRSSETLARVQAGSHDVRHAAESISKPSLRIAQLALRLTRVRGALREVATARGAARQLHDASCALSERNFADVAAATSVAAAALSHSCLARTNLGRRLTAELAKLRASTVATAVPALTSYLRSALSDIESAPVEELASVADSLPEGDCQSVIAGVISAAMPWAEKQVRSVTTGELVAAYNAASGRAEARVTAQLLQKLSPAEYVHFLLPRVASVASEWCNRPLHLAMMLEEQGFDGKGAALLCSGLRDLAVKTTTPAVARFANLASYLQRSFTTGGATPAVMLRAVTLYDSLPNSFVDDDDVRARVASGISQTRALVVEVAQRQHSLVAEAAKAAIEKSVLSDMWRGVPLPPSHCPSHMATALQSKAGTFSIAEAVAPTSPAELVHALQGVGITATLEEDAKKLCVVCIDDKRFLACASALHCVGLLCDLHRHRAALQCPNLFLPAIDEVVKDIVLTFHSLSHGQVLLARAVGTVPGLKSVSARAIAVLVSSLSLILAVLHALGLEEATENVVVSALTEHIKAAKLKLHEIFGARLTRHASKYQVGAPALTFRDISAEAAAVAQIYIDVLPVVADAEIERIHDVLEDHFMDIAGLWADGGRSEALRGAVQELVEFVRSSDNAVLHRVVPEETIDELVGFSGLGDDEDVSEEEEAEA